MIWHTYVSSKGVCLFPAVISTEFYWELPYPTLLDLYYLCFTIIKFKHGVMHWEDLCPKKAQKKYCESVSMKMLKPWKDIWRLNLMKEDKIFIISFQIFLTEIVINSDILKSRITRRKTTSKPWPLIRLVISKWEVLTDGRTIMDPLRNLFISKTNSKTV